MSKTFTESEVVTLIVTTCYECLGDEWIPQEDDNLKEFMGRNGLLETFLKEYSND